MNSSRFCRNSTLKDCMWGTPPQSSETTCGSCILGAPRMYTIFPAPSRPNFSSDAWSVFASLYEVPWIFNAATSKKFIPSIKGAAICNVCSILSSMVVIGKCLKQMVIMEFTKCGFLFCIRFTSMSKLHLRSASSMTRPSSRTISVLRFWYCSGGVVQETRKARGVEHRCTCHTLQALGIDRFVLYAISCKWSAVPIQIGTRKLFLGQCQVSLWHLIQSEQIVVPHCHFQNILHSWSFWYWWDKIFDSTVKLSLTVRRIWRIVLNIVLSPFSTLLFHFAIISLEWTINFTFCITMTSDTYRLRRVPGRSIWPAIRLAPHPDASVGFFFLLGDKKNMYSILERLDRIESILVDLTDSQPTFRGGKLVNKTEVLTAIKSILQMAGTQDLNKK